MFASVATPVLSFRHGSSLKRRTLLRGGLLGVAVLALAPVGRAAAGPTTTIAWENIQESGPLPVAALRDSDASVLSAGSNDPGDGAIVALGYFTGATTAAGFNGSWVPLTGPQSANIPFQRTTVGDTDDGAGVASGFFTLQTDFDSSNSAVYQRVPAPGTRLCVAVYNGPTLATSTRFNIVTRDDWQWQDPTGPIPTPPIYLNIAASDAQWYGGGDSALRTVVPTSAFPGDAARPPAKLVNISTRGWVGTGDQVMIAGFVLTGSGSSEVLTRAVGPGLTHTFGLGGVLADPHLRLFRQSDPSQPQENDNWADVADPNAVDAAFATTGAFPLETTSTDAALLATLPVSSGGYTALVSGPGGATGIALAEVYLVDLPSPDSAELVNLSTRGFVGTGDNVMIPGFVVGGGGPRRLLIRAAGPSWGALWGLSGVLQNPRIRVVASASPDLVLAESDDWEDDGQGPAVAAAATQAGAFPLNSGGRDAALLLQLDGAPGSRGFTVQVSGTDGGTGLVLTEIYALP